jgi:hypothetical protein
MKKFIFGCALLSTCLSFSQIKVIETTPIIRLGSIGQNDVYIQNEGDKYTFYYKNIENEDVITTKSFMFRDLDDDFENLHKIILNGFESNPLLDIKLEMPDEYVWLHYSKSLDRTFVQFMTRNKKNEATGFSKVFTVDQINKLFEKKSPKRNTEASKDDTMSEFK